MRTRALLLALAATAALGSGCGGGDDDSGLEGSTPATSSSTTAGAETTASAEKAASPDAKAVAEVVRKTLVTVDPDNCTLRQTQRFVDQNYLGTGKRALDACRDVENHLPADDADVSRVKVGDRKATARVKIIGGDADGSVVDVALIKDGSRWKLDQITGVELDFPRFLKGQGAQLRRQKILAAKEITCVVNAIRALGEAKLEEITVSGEEKPLIDIVPRCAQDALQKRIDKSFRESLSEQDIPEEIIDCALDGLRSALDDEDRTRLFRSILEGESKEVLTLLRAALTGCARERGSGKSDDSTRGPIA